MKILKIVHVKNSGFTLVELMVAVMIFSFIVAGMYSVSAVAQRSWEVNRVKIELQQSLRVSMERMANELRQAGASSINVLPQDATNMSDYDNWYTQITFKIPTGVTSGEVDWMTNEAVYQVDGTTLQRKEDTTTTKIAQNIQALRFFRSTTNSDLLMINLVGQKDSLLGDPIEYDLTFNLQLRN